MISNPTQNEFFESGQEAELRVGGIVYEADWYSGSQIMVMMGDILIDDAVGITIRGQQQKVPVWGYASQYYSFVADGQVSFSGELTIAFKETAYLLFPARRYANQVRNTREGGPLGTSPKYDSSGNLGGKHEGITSLVEMAKLVENQKNMTANVELMIGEGAATDPAAQREYFKRMRNLRTMDDTAWENMAEVFEDVIWHGAEKANPGTRDQLFSRNIQENTEIDDDMLYSHRRLDQYPPVDIWIVYGNPDHPAANHTVRKCLDVSFTGQVQAIEISGNPTLETYQFFCRNFV